MNIFFGVIGVFAILFIAFLLSSNRRAINLRTVGFAFLIQVVFAMLVLYIPFGQKILGGMAIGVSNALSAGREGVKFVFGPLADANPGFIFAISVLAVIVFFASLISVLYYIRVMPLIINTIGLGLHKLLGTSRAESLSATANIFVGQTEAPLVIKPFLATMTKSEIFTVMVGGLASVSGGVIAGYASLGIDIKYLIAASFMSAPGGLLMAKMILPETEAPIQTLEEADKKAHDADKPTNIIDAAAEGAKSGLFLSVNVGAMLIAFIGLTYLVDMILGGVGGWFGFDHLSLKLILGYLFSPIAFIIGIPWNEAIVVGGFLGEKMVLNEFVAYISFTQVMQSISAHSQVITTFALCGFANISSIGILLGGMGTLVPSKRSTIANLAVKAVLAGTLSNLMSATLAGIFTSL